MTTSDDHIKRALGITPTEKATAADRDRGGVEPEPIFQIILTEYLSQYSPAVEYRPGVIIQSTADIIAALEDMVDLSHDEANAVLYNLGFRPGHNSSGYFGWMLSLSH